MYFVLAPEVHYELKKNEPKEETKQKVGKGNRLAISSIGVDAKIGLPSSSLNTGGWVEKTNRDGIPLVIAIHRFGLNTLTPKQKIKQTLYHVDKLHQGDEIYLFWNNEEYQYRITRIIKSDNNPSIRDSELLIYTCKFWNSAERVFVLAERI